MPVIAKVGRNNTKTRLLLLFIYLLLSIGALSMVYPFALMISTSFTSYADYNEYQVIPRFFYNNKVLLKKYLVDKYIITYLRYQYGQEWYQPRDINVDLKAIDRKNSIVDQDLLSQTGILHYKRKAYTTLNSLDSIYYYDENKLNAIINDWQEFYKTCPRLFCFATFCHSGNTNYSVLDIKPQYHEWLKKKYETIKVLNQTYTENATKFSDISIPYENPVRQRWLLPLDIKYKDWQEFKKSLPFYKNWVISANLAFQEHLRKLYPDLNELNKATHQNFTSYADLTLYRTLKDRLLPESQINEFIHKKCPLIFLKLSPSLAPKFKAFLEKKYSNFKEPLKSQKLAAPFSSTCPMDTTYSGRTNDWIEFMENHVASSDIHINDPTLLYQKFLKNKYKDISTINEHYGWAADKIEDIPLPTKYIDIYGFRKTESNVYWTYITGNYKMVLNMLAIHGRALFNTTIYVIMSILAALTVNPLAAYALSRYRLKHTNKILLFLLATMAFPPSVGMIPGFLLLKDLNLLNTFAALILPGVANGYCIFLLKGFFDSLPAELYEAASIDGASEMSIFAQIALPMTKPILAITALGAFTGAYSAFMFAFLVCQDPKMWTIMVFLYEFQQMYPNYLVMASLVVAAIPTLLVFIFCQNIILRGIVVPTFK